MRHWFEDKWNSDAANIPEEQQLVTPITNTKQDVGGKCKNKSKQASGTKQKLYIWDMNQVNVHNQHVSEDWRDA